MPEKESDSCAHDERQARSIALEKAYVHDVYDQIAPHFTDNKYHAWPRVKQFLLDLEPGSIVADIGCGNGKYLDVNNEVYKIGSDRCAPLTHTARRRRYEVLIADNLHLPFRDESFDAALSVAVIHHFATTERRIQALQELARILRIGGRVMITVWAMEQRHRKFESQDVLVPWYRPDKSSSDDRGSSAERDLTSTTTSDDDILIYQAYSHTSDSDINNTPVTQPADKRLTHKRELFSSAKGHHQGHSFDTVCNQNNTEMSSSGETCYNFLRRALQKLSNPGASYIRKQSYFYRKCRTSWFSDSLDSDPGENGHIELRHLEEEPAVMDTSSPPVQTEVSPSSHRFKSLGDLFQIIPNILRPKKLLVDQEENREKRVSTASDPREYARKPGPTLNGIVRSRSTACCLFQYEDYQGNGEEKVVASNSLTSSDIANGNIIIIDHVSMQTQTTESTSDEDKEDPNMTIQDETANQELHSHSVVKIAGEYGNLMPESPPSHDEEEDDRLVSYWSMPELRFLSESSIIEESLETKPETDQLTSISQTAKILSNRKTNREEDSSFVIPKKTVEDEKIKLLRNGFVKRSLSIDINAPKISGDHQQFSSSIDENIEYQPAACSSPRWNSLKNEIEETVSMVQWKGQSLQSDTSVESDESIISVIYRSPSEVEALAGRTRRTSRSLQASPLTITSRGGSVEANSESSDMGIKMLCKYMDAEGTEVREILEDIKPFGWKSKLDEEYLKNRRSRSTSVDLDFRPESRLASSKDLRRSSLPCPMYVRKSLEIEEEEEDEDSKNDTVEVFTTKEEDNSATSKSTTFRRLCRSEPIDLSEDELDNLPDDDDESAQDIKSDQLFDSKAFSCQSKSLLNKEGYKACKKPVSILKYCYRASSLEEQSSKRVRLPRRSLSDASDPLSPIKELKSSRVRLCVEERPRGGGSASRWTPTLIWQYSPPLSEADSNSEKHEEKDEKAINQKLEISMHMEEKDSAIHRSLKQQSSEENDTSSMQFSHPSSTTSEDYSDLRRHFTDEERRYSSDHSRNAKDIIREDSSDHDYSMPTQDIVNFSDSSDRKSSFVRESSEEQNQEESFDQDVSSVTASIGSKDTEDELPPPNHLRRLSGCQTDKRSRSTDDSDVDLMQTSSTSIPENSFGKLEILPITNADEIYDVTEWTSRNCDQSDYRSNLSRNTSQSLSTSQESLVGNEAGGPMTYHRYYHVFREGELDHLIESQVENLHIISSYYDHANWCVVAEKVRVWTI